MLNLRKIKPSLLAAAIFLAVFCLGTAAQAAEKFVTSGPSPEFLAYQKQLQNKTGGTKNYGYRPSPLNWSHLKGISYSITENNLKKAVLPAKYDLRDKMPPVKNQNPFGTCWTHSAMAATESNIITRGMAASNDIKLAEWYLAYFGYNDESPNLPAFDGDVDYYNTGGDDWMSVALLSRGTGSVLRSQVPYPTSPANVYIPNITERTYKLKDALYLGNLNEREVALRGDRVTMIKEALMAYGALSIGIYQYRDSLALNSETGAYFGSFRSNRTTHAVTIVGWDDDYAVSNFRSDNKPSEPGAWIVRNSWGTGWGDKGYYYVSYQEGSLADGVAYVTDRAPKGEKIYQHDPLGCIDWILNTGQKKLTAANVFMASGNNERITSVAFYTAVPNAKYTIKIYANVKDDYPTSGDLSCTKTVTVAVPGYHTIDLDSAVSVARGSSFSVVLEQESGIYDAMMPVECYQYGNTSKATSNKGESWYYDDEKQQFIDLYTAKFIKKANFCIKAFAYTVTSKPEEPVYPTSADILAILQKYPTAFTVSGDKVYANENTRNNALDSVLKQNPDLKVDGGMRHMPVVSADAQSGGYAYIKIPVSDGVFEGITNTRELGVMKILPDGAGELFKRVNKVSELDDKTYAVLDENGDVCSGDTALDKTKHSIGIYIRDGGAFDIDGTANGTVLDPAAILKIQQDTPAPSGGGSSGGCNGGFAALALLALVPVIARRKK